MNLRDYFRFSISAIIRHPLRAILTILAITIGVASIVVLTGLGEGARRYVMGEFSALGSNLLIVIPGKSETSGGVLNLLSGETPRDLTLEDANSLHQHSLIKRVAPIVVGSAYVSHEQLSRETTIIGTNSEMLRLRQWHMAQGRFLPKSSDDRSDAICVIGSRIKQELFQQRSAIGQRIRISDRQFRIIGVMASSGRSIGLDVQDLVIIPTAAAMSLYNSPSLFRIMVETRSREAMPAVKQHIIDTIRQRHQGEEDITVISQDSVLQTFDRIFIALTLTITGIAAISLTVAGVLIMNIMLVSISQRTAEIGLLKAIGASHRQIIGLFMTEALLISGAGALIGVGTGHLINHIIRQVFPLLDNAAPTWSIVAAFMVALLTGLVFSIMPARRAAELNPINALAHR